MAEKRSYWELLKDPRWQRKRLEILNLHGFACENCGAEDKTLHVHHSYYEKGLAPWEYPDESLHALCEDCHRKAQDLLVLLHRQIGRLDLGNVDLLYGYALGLEAHNFPSVVLDVFSYEVAQGVGDCWGLTASEVINALVESQIDGYKLSALRDAARDARGKN